MPAILSKADEQRYLEEGALVVTTATTTAAIASPTRLCEYEFTPPPPPPRNASIATMRIRSSTHITHASTTRSRPLTGKGPQPILSLVASAATGATTAAKNNWFGVIVKQAGVIGCSHVAFPADTASITGISHSPTSSC